MKQLNRFKFAHSTSLRWRPCSFPVSLICLFLVGGLWADRARGDTPLIALQLLEEGFTAPTGLVSLADGSGRLLLADQAGVIYALNREGKKLAEPFLDIRSRLVSFNPGMDERGLLGLALHPKFSTNGRFFVVYSAPLRPQGPPGWNHTMRLSEFRVLNPGAAVAAADSERVVLEIDEPDWNHNSGRIAFGPDGLLYWTVGDGSAPNDVGLGHAPEGNGQHLDTLLGKVLRIDVDNGQPYAIPQDNPFADGKHGRPEIYAYGMRNPWGISFAPDGDRELIVVDVGQDRFEEINVIVKGGNYGWRVREGFSAFTPVQGRRRGQAAAAATASETPQVGADGKPFIDPVLVYKILRSDTNDPEALGISITGGYVYRGQAFPDLKGKYLFGDWSRSMAIPSGSLFVATRPSPDAASPRWTMAPLPLVNHPDGRLHSFVWSLGEDQEGEIYVMTNDANMIQGSSGKLYKLVPSP
jgi:glucose/arabinose dehydrogenase